jgi:hypothetical protein
MECANSRTAGVAALNLSATPSRAHTTNYVTFVTFAVEDAQETGNGNQKDRRETPEKRDKSLIFGQSRSVLKIVKPANTHPASASTSGTKVTGWPLRPGDDGRNPWRQDPIPLMCDATKAGAFALLRMTMKSWNSG